MPEDLVARQFWVEEPGRGGIRTATIPGPEPGEVQVRALYSGISRGTESLVFRGRVPESQRNAMRAPHQEGDFPGPVKYGYLSVGEVVDGVPALRGRTVFCLHPHQDVYVVEAGDVTPLPEDVPAERAVLAGNLETALNGVWDGGPGPGDRITVFGAGVVGLLVAWLCAPIPGTRVRIVDPNPRRREPAERLGAEYASDPPEDGDSDLVFHASGNPEGLADALAAAGAEARVVELSWFGDASVELPLGEEFHSRRLTLRSSQVGALAPSRRPRWTRKRRMKLALALLRDERLDTLISGESPFEELPAVLARLSDRGSDVLCHRIRYE